jgi:hypothetical protein
MSLNIKSPHAHALATELAHRMNTSLTEAVTVALQDKLAATETEAIVERRVMRLRTMANEIAARLTPEQRAMNIDEELYDEYGLPK